MALRRNKKRANAFRLRAIAVSPSMSNNDNLSFLPNPGEGRKWVCIHNPKSRTNPLTLQLVERFARGRRGASTVIGFEYATADRKDLENKANDVLDRVGDYDKFVGEYDRENTE